jgi:hypothetical protein
MRQARAPVHPSCMMTLARLRALELGAVLVAIYLLALALAIRGIPSQAIAVGLALDLTVTAAAATWWLGVRGGRLPKQAPFVVLGAGVLTSRLLLPAEAVKVAIVIGLGLEAIVLATIAARLPRLIRGLRRAAHLPALLRLAEGFESAGVPRWLAGILATEVSMLGLALTGWFRRASRHGFTVHRTHCSIAIDVVLAWMIVLETFVAHLLLARVSVVAAWISTGCSLYALLWLVGDAHALRLGRVRIERDDVVIEVARRWAAVIPRRTIVAVREAAAVAEGAIDLAIETPTVELELSAPVTARGPFGLTRTGTRVALTIDDAAGFVAALGR